MLKSIAHEDSDVKKVIFNVTKAIAELSHYRDIVMLSDKAGANATTTMIVIDVVLSDLVEKSCEWVRRNGLLGVRTRKHTRTL